MTLQEYFWKEADGTELIVFVEQKKEINEILSTLDKEYVKNNIVDKMAQIEKEVQRRVDAYIEILNRDTVKREDETTQTKTTR